MAGGFTRSDIGSRLSWGDFKDFLENLPPNGESAYFRAIKPRSWWVTPEYVAMKHNTYAVELGNWQRAGGKKAGAQPKPPKFPEDSQQQISAEDFHERRTAQREHLARARASGRRRKTVQHINPGQEVKRGA